MSRSPRHPAGSGGDHERYDELAVGWALHALEPEDEAVFTVHRPGCPLCAQTVADTQEVMAALASDLPDAEPSDGLRDRLRAAVEETEQLPRTAPPVDVARPAAPVPVPTGASVARPAPAGPQQVRRPGALGDLRPPRATRAPDPRPSWRRVLPGALVAAAVAAILALGTWNVVLTGDRDAAQATAARQEQVLRGLLEGGRAVVAPLTDPDRPAGQPVATVVARAGKVQVVSSSLRVNDQQRDVYVVWGIQGSSATALGTFDVVSPRTDLRNVGSTATGLDEFPTYGISLEPGRQAPSAPTDIVATGQVTS